MIVGSAKPVGRQRVKESVESARANVQPLESWQEAKMTSLHGFHYRCDFKESKVVECAVMKEMSLKARDVLSHKALY